MFTHTTRLYDKIYGFKDYESAANRVRGIVDEWAPGAKSLLDVGCGTGRHLATLALHYEVEGLDLDPGLIVVARERLPRVPFHVGDMRQFDLNGRFDAVTCLFSAIAYLETIEGVEQAIACMCRHLNPGGVLLVEPWFAPENYWQGKVTGNFLDEPDLKVAWIYVNDREGDVSVLDIHYTVGTPSGIEQFREVHRMGLFTRDQYLNAFGKAGMTAVHDADGLFNRGLYVARRQR